MALLLCLSFLLTEKALLAHPMGNFSINHYTRLAIDRNGISGRYVLDLAEIPTVTEMSRLDANHDGNVSEAEQSAYIRLQCAQLGRNLTFRANGEALPFKVEPEGVALRPGAGGLQTLRLTLMVTAPLPPVARQDSLRIDYKDRNFPERTGWKEIVVTGNTGVVNNSSVPAVDISKELTIYPSDPTTAPPQNTEARFTVRMSAFRDSAQADARPPSDPRSKALSNSINNNTPQDRFTQSIAADGLTPGLIALSIASAFVFGAIHALSPGHGKAMVAAYLVGTHGTARHAVLLGLVVTVTHTLGVFALGFLTLSASRYIVPERLYPVISGLSGTAVACMGIGLLWSRLAAWKFTRQYGAEDEDESGTLSQSEFLNARRSVDPPSLRTLIGLGITGGALPCPSALVVMLSAIALHRIVFGLLLIVSFSLGLAIVLTVLGLLIMRARGILERIPSVGRLTAGISVASAGVVTVVGVLLVIRALSGRF